MDSCCFFSVFIDAIYSIAFVFLSISNKFTSLLWQSRFVIKFLLLLTIIFFQLYISHLSFSAQDRCSRSFDHLRVIQLLDRIFVEFLGKSTVILKHSIADNILEGIISAIFQRGQYCSNSIFFHIIKSKKTLQYHPTIRRFSVILLWLLQPKIRLYFGQEIV